MIYLCMVCRIIREIRRRGLLRATLIVSELMRVEARSVVEDCRHDRQSQCAAKRNRERHQGKNRGPELAEEPDPMERHSHKPQSEAKAYQSHQAVDIADLLCPACPCHKAHAN